MATDVIQAVKARLTLSDVVRRYVDLRPVSGRWMGACPFHQETQPSFSVNDEEGFFYCFGCQASGDLLDFHMRINGLEFKESLQQLAQEAGVDLGEHRPDPKAQEEQRRRKVFLEMHDKAREFYRGCLAGGAGAPARAYMARRGMAREVVEAFGLGYAPDDWHALDNHLRQLGYTPQQGVEAGLLTQNDKGRIYDRFRGRLVFPIQELSGRVIAFGGRIITEGEPKYLNSSDSPIYKKGEHLYGLYQARQAMTRTRRALLTEGYVDVLTLSQFGYKDACGVLGTALTREQVKRLAGFCTRIDLVFDGDSAGRKAALKSSRMILAQGVKCGVVLLPEGEDVDSLLMQQGKQAFDACLDEARDGLDFALDTVREEYAPRDVLAWARDFLDQLADESLRAWYLPRLADGLRLDEAELRRHYSGSRRSKATPQPPRMQAAQNVREVDRLDLYLLEFAVNNADYVPELHRIGMGGALESQWAQRFWDTIRLHEDQEVYRHLDEDEKRFWSRCRDKDFQCTGQELLQEWEHIKRKIAERLEQRSREGMKARLKAACSGGLDGSAAECLRALNDAIRRGDE